MKFVCLNCKKTFIYCAKVTDYNPTTKDGVPIQNMIPSSTIEAHVCPYCKSLNVDEYVEPQPNITSVISISIEEVDTKLKEGYVVRELYAKTATLVKLDKKKETS